MGEGEQEWMIQGTMMKYNILNNELLVLSFSVFNEMMNREVKIKIRSSPSLSRWLCQEEMEKTWQPGDLVHRTCYHGNWVRITPSLISGTENMDFP